MRIEREENLLLTLAKNRLRRFETDQIELHSMGVVRRRVGSPPNFSEDPAPPVRANSRCGETGRHARLKIV